jgi:hypothetical protein
VEPHRPIDPARTVFRAQLLALVATGWIMWRVTFFPAAIARVGLGALISLAVWYPLCAAIICAVITAILLGFTRALRRERVMAASLEAAGAAAWIAPAVTLWNWPSPWAAGAGANLAAASGRILYAHWKRIRRAALPSGQLPDGFWPQHSLRSLSFSLVLQLGVLAFLAPAPQTLAAWCAITAGVLMIYAIRLRIVRARAQTRWRRALAGAIPMIALAALIVVLAGLQIRNGSPGGPGSPRPYPMPAQAARARVPTGGEASTANLGGEFSGVILRPEVKPVPMLIEPMPTSPALLRRLSKRPFVIPFSGDYWMFRWPFNEPPPTATVRTGNPTRDSFKTVDSFPLNMDAHQFLQQPIDLSCCSKVQVEIQNADRYPGTVALELYVLLGNGPSRRLGSARVTSIPDLSGEAVVPVTEVLDFPVPADAAGQFDHIRAVFRRARYRESRSARIAIVRFLLVGK